jgi:DNA-binding IclR family transcriptional regulator
MAVPSSTRHQSPHQVGHNRQILRELSRRNAGVEGYLVVKMALAASRATQVIDYLSVHPGQPLSLTEISRALGINAASTLSVLAALADSGYVIRHPTHKTYTLGAALVAVGHAALMQHPTLEAARQELSLVADEIEAQCTASVLMGDLLVAVVAEGRARSSGTWSRIGTRVPFSAPFGAPFAAFGDESLRLRWLGGRSGADLDEARTRRLEDALSEVRERGYAVWRDSETREKLGQKLWALADEPRNAALRLEVERLLEELSDGFVAVNLDPAEIVQIANVTAPVFSPSGEVIMILTGIGFASPLNGTAVANVGARLRASAQVIAMRTFGSSALPDGREKGSHRIGAFSSKEVQE